MNALYCTNSRADRQFLTIEKKTNTKYTVKKPSTSSALYEEYTLCVEGAADYICLGGWNISTPCYCGPRPPLFWTEFYKLPTNSNKIRHSEILICTLYGHLYKDRFE